MGLDRNQRRATEAESTLQESVLLVVGQDDVVAASLPRQKTAA
jgi:hypothetical protein